MKRLFSLLLPMLLLFFCTACVGRAAAPEPDVGQAAPLDAAVQPPEEELPPQLAEPVPLPPKEEPAPRQEEPYVRVIDPAKPMVALTFDDGPDETCSGQILDILEENHALATFFEVGRNVAACPEPVARMAEMGCEIGSHSNAHKDLSKLRKSALLRDLDTADEAFAAAGAPVPALVRPPYGAVNKTVKSATGRAMVTWTVDTEDWRSRDAQAVIEYVQGLGDLDGEIVLMHSIYESTVEAVRVLVPWLQEQGYQLVTVTELMAYYYGELPQPDRFYGYTYFSTHGRTDAPVELPGADLPEEAEPAPDAEAAPDAEPAPVPEPEPVPEVPDEPQEPFDPTGIVIASQPEPEAPAPERPALPSGQDAARETLSPGTSISDPAVFHP